MTDQQLRGLEKMRAGADLVLLADLTLTALADTKNWPVAQSQEIIRIPHATWSNALAQLDAGAFVDVLIPIPIVEARATAARRIREAKTAIRDGRYEHAVTLARQALDAVRNDCDTVNVNARALSKPKKDDRDQEERWAVLTQSAYHLFSGAPHDDAGNTDSPGPAPAPLRPSPPRRACSPGWRTCRSTTASSAVTSTSGSREGPVSNRAFRGYLRRTWRVVITPMPTRIATPKVGWRNAMYVPIRRRAAVARCARPARPRFCCSP